MAKSGIFYLLELETDGWGWWTKTGRIVKQKYEKTTQWIGKERFLKAGVCTTSYHTKNGYPYNPRPNWDDSFYYRKFRYEKEGLKILDVIIVLEVVPCTLNPEFMNNHYKLEEYFEKEFKRQYDYTPTKRFSGWTECYTLDLKNNFSSVKTFMKEWNNECRVSNRA